MYIFSNEMQFLTYFKIKRSNEVINSAFKDQNNIMLQFHELRVRSQEGFKSIYFKSLSFYILNCVICHKVIYF